ncbi:hypothetical protein POTOM_061332 [Populus tomentosa]|uniref:Nucleotide-sugar transporter family protein n=1 Tax=Populus tomentosa TaxID=118781 RepID=A0A8X8C0B2_POPTO|nr:hypothetical protein POTOM_061332 [Populus tomentosa]
MEYRKIKDEEDQIGDGVVGDAVTSRGVSPSKVTSFPTGSVDRLRWKRKMVVTLALTILTSSQAILIVWSKRAGKYEYSVTTANFMVETLKCALSLAALARTWKKEGVTEDNRLSTTFDEVKVYPIPAALYLVKNLLQYYIFAYVNAPGYQILKNLNIISTGVLYRIILKRKLSEVQWAGFILLCAGCTTAQLNPSSDHVLETPLQGWMMAIVMALLSGFAGVYTEAIIKKRPSRNINVQNFWLYVFGMIFNALAIVTQDFDAVVNKGFFYGYSLITTLMILNHALSGIAVSMVMKFADNIVKHQFNSTTLIAVSNYWKDLGFWPLILFTKFQEFAIILGFLPANFNTPFSLSIRFSSLVGGKIGVETLVGGLINVKTCFHFLLPQFNADILCILPQWQCFLLQLSLCFYLTFTCPLHFSLAQQLFLFQCIYILLGRCKDRNIVLLPFLTIIM